MTISKYVYIVRHWRLGPQYISWGNTIQNVLVLSLSQMFFFNFVLWKSY